MTRAAVPRPTGPEPSSGVAALDLLGGVALAIFLTAGWYKSVPTLARFPFDITVGAAALVAALVLFRVVVRGRVSRAVGWALGVFVSFLPALGMASFGPYSASKSARLFTLTLLAAVAPPVLLQRRLALKAFISALMTVGIAMALDAGLHPGARPELYGRFSAFNSNTIALGRAAGIVVVVGLISMVHYRDARRVYSVVMVGIGLFAMVGAGSRGPLLAVAVAGLLTLFSALGARGKVRAAAALLLLAALGQLTFRSAPEASADRLSRLGTSGDARVVLYKETVAGIVRHPFGIGWGDFAELEGAPSGSERLYPHNIGLEVMAEGGLLAAAGFLALLAKASWSAYRRVRNRGDLTDRIVLGLLAFTVANAMVSGDINDNRLLFCFVTLSVVRRHHAAKPDTSTRPTAPPPRSSAAGPTSPRRALAGRAIYLGLWQAAGHGDGRR